MDDSSSGEQPSRFAASAVPMIWGMIAGIAGSLFSYLVLARRRSTPAAG